MKLAGRAVLEPAELRTMVTEELGRMQELYAARGMQMVRSP